MRRYTWQPVVAILVCLPIVAIASSPPRGDRYWLVPFGVLAGLTIVGAVVYLAAPFFRTAYGKLFLVGLALILIAFALFRGG